MENTPLYYEKKAIKKAANAIAFACLFVPILSFVASNVLTILYMPFFEIYNNDSTVQLLYSSAVTVPCYLLAGLFVVKCDRRKISEVGLFGASKKGLTVPAIFMGLAAATVGNILCSLFASLLDGTVLEPKMQGIDMPESITGIIIYFICVAVFPALVEEFFFRGIVLSSLKKFGTGFAVVVSSIMFALIHGNLVQIPFALTIGLALGFLYVETGSIWPGVIVHFINNLTASALELLGKFIPAVVVNLINYSYMALAVILGVAFAARFFYRKEDAGKWEKSMHKTPDGKKYKYFFTAVVMILFFINVISDVISAQVAA